MSNLTITIDDELLRTARIKAVQQGTSVNEVCRKAIAAFALDDAAQARARAHARAQAFVDLTEQIGQSTRRATGWHLSRDEMYEEMLAEKSPPARKR